MGSWADRTPAAQARTPRSPRTGYRDDDCGGAGEPARRVARRRGDADHIGRWRGVYQAGEEKSDYAWIVELGGFHVSGPCTPTEVTRRFGHGSYRVTAYGFDPAGLRWEVLVEDLAAT